MKWAGIVITPLLLALWIASGWWMNEVMVDPSPIVMVGGGRLDVLWFRKWSFVPRSVWAGPVLRNDQPFEWWFDYEPLLSPAGSVVGWGMSIPIWSLVLMTGVPTFRMCQRDRRRRRAELANSCRKCGYSRSGLPADRPCPECGAVRDA